MEYALAALILNETGEEINEHNLTAVLDAAGAPVVESRTKALVAALEGVDLDGAIRDGSGPEAGPLDADGNDSSGSGDTSEAAKIETDGV